VRRVTLVTSDHTHRVIGTGSGDPEKFDPEATRETLDHSVMYLFAVALEDGTVTPEASYTPERRHRPSTLGLWRAVETAEDPEWTARYHHPDPARRAFGGAAVIDLADGGRLTEELAVADAHPAGARPFGTDDYVAKFESLVGERSTDHERQRVVARCRGLAELGPGEVVDLVPEVVDAGALVWQALGSPGVL
jgi:2-methylcitrate dehydratase